MLVVVLALLSLGAACAPTVAPQPTPKAASATPNPAASDRDQVLAAGRVFFEANKLNDELRRLEFKLTTGGFEDADLAAFRSTVERFEQQLGGVRIADLPPSAGPVVQAAGTARLKAVKWLIGAAKRGSMVDTSSQEAKDWLASQSSWDSARVALLNALQERGVSATDVGYVDAKPTR
jgi:hypothetical protein